MLVLAIMVAILMALGTWNVHVAACRCAVQPPRHAPGPYTLVSMFCSFLFRFVQTYVHVPDWKIPLTKKGFGDGQRAGEKIKEYIGDKPLFIYTSPYLRTKQVCGVIFYILFSVMD